MLNHMENRVNSTLEKGLSVETMFRYWLKNDFGNSTKTC